MTDRATPTARLTERALTRRRLLRDAALTVGLSMAALISACGQAPPAPAPSAPASSSSSATTISAVASKVTTSATTSASSTAAGAPKPGGSLVVASTSDAPSLEPHLEGAETRTRRTVLLYDGLTALDKDLKIQPGLAEKWDTPNDTTYIFHLRKGVKFHNGKELDADDVKFTFDRVLDEKSGSPGRGDITSIDSVEPVDKYTVKMTLKQPSATLLTALALKYTLIIPKDSAPGKSDALRKTAIGTGPFKVESWSPNDKLVLKKFPDYWGKGQPYLDQITMQVVPDEASIVAGLRTGTIHMARLEDLKNYGLVKDEKGLTTMRSSGASWDYFDMSLDHPPLDNQKLRQAIALAIDKEACLRATAQSLGQVTDMLPPVLKDWLVPLDKLPYSKRDVEKAKQLVKESGLPQPIKIEIRAIPTLPSMVNNAQVIVANLAEIGIQAEFKNLEYGIWIEAYLKGNFQATTNLGGGLVDPDIIFYRKFHSQPKGADFHHIKNPEIDKLLDDGRTTLDPQKRKAIYDQLQPKLSELAAFVPLYAGDIIEVMQNFVKGYQQHPTGWAYALKETWIDK